MSTDDEENGNGKGGGRPNAYWQRIRDAEESLIEEDTYGGSFRGVRAAPHGGSVAVRPEETIGADDYCWCGQPQGHDWPGKQVGAKHPRETMMNTQAKDRIERGSLRAYHRSLQNFIMHAVNDHHLRFRVGKNTILLYPPDGTAPATVYARATDRQLHQLVKWYTTHVQIEEENKSDENGTVEPEVVAKLAEAINDPVEHPTKKAEPEPEPEPDTVITAVTEKGREKLAEAEAPVAPPPPPREEPILAGIEWHAYYSDKSTEPHEFIETDGTNLRCKVCVGTDHELNTTDRRSVGGHVRMWHRDRGNLYDPDVRSAASIKAVQTKRDKRIKAAIQAVMKELGMEENTVEIKAMREKLKDQAAYALQQSDRIRELEAELKTRADDDALQAATKRAEDAEAKLALAREAMGL